MVGRRNVESSHLVDVELGTAARSCPGLLATDGPAPTTGRRTGATDGPGGAARTDVAGAAAPGTFSATVAVVGNTPFGHAARNRVSHNVTGALSAYERAALRFDVTDVGPADGRVVIMLHGFPEDRFGWSDLAAPLADAGYRVLAPDQRGYSPSASPRHRRAYRLSELIDDVLTLADAAGTERFDLVGHDWGSLVGWGLAGRHPERVRSLCALSVPHPGAMRHALTRSTQALASSYVLFFQLPWLPERVLARRGGRLLAEGLERSGLDHATAQRFASRAAEPAGMTGPLNWYRAIPLDGASLPGPVTVPTLFVWGDRERFVTRRAAEACGRWVKGPYRFVPLPGRTHWLPTTAADVLAPILGEHLTATAD